MPIKFIRGNIFTSKSQTLVNTVNCVGVMGAGIALEFKYRYPKMYDEYVKLCEEKHIKIGTLWLYRKEVDRKWVLNFPTKQHWKFESKEEYLVKGLQKFVETYNEKSIQSIAFPLLGADKGGLDPEISKAIMVRYLSHCDIPIEIYEYDPDAEDDLIHIARSLLLGRQPKEIARSTDISLIAINKIKTALKNDINSLSRLATIKGIGETTLEKLYQFIIRHSKIPQAVTQEFFHVSKKSNGNEYTLVIQQKPEAPSNLSLNEKVALTGLDDQTVFNIEHENENVTIKDLKTYCRKLQINPKQMIDKYFEDLLQQLQSHTK